MRQEKLGIRQLRIKKSDIIIYLLVLCLFLPSNIGSAGIIGSFFKLLNNVAVCYVLLNMVKNFLRIPQIGIKRDRFIIAYVLFIMVQFATIYLNHGEYLWIPEFKQVVTIIYMFTYLRSNGDTSEGISPILYAFWTWALIDTLITIQYPNGMPALANGYLLGWKNNKAETFIVAQMLGLYKYYLISTQKRKRAFAVQWCVFAAFGILNALIAKSSTTLVVMVLLALFMFVPEYIQKCRLLNMPVILSLYAVLWFVIVIGQGRYEIINNLMYFLFEKDATFTGRTMVWKSAMYMISKKPVFGYGQYGFININESGYYYNWGTAHNQILELLMEGGIILLVSWVILFIVAIKKSWIPRSEYQRVAIVVAILVLISCLTEAALTETSILILLLIYWGGELGERRREDIS